MPKTYTPQQLRQRLDRLPRLQLAALPTPLDDLPRFSSAVGGPRILMKREDLTGLAMGGNKIREFEYSIAPAVESGCDVLIHGAAAQSNLGTCYHDGTGVAKDAELAAQATELAALRARLPNEGVPPA